MLYEEEDVKFLVLYNRNRNSDGTNSLRFVKYAVKFLEKANQGPGYFADRDALPGTDIFDELGRVLSKTRYVICVITPGFTEWNLWTSKAAFKSLIGEDESGRRCTSGDRRCLVLALGLSRQEVVDRCFHFTLEEVLEVPQNYQHDAGEEVDVFWAKVLRVIALGVPLAQVEQEMTSGEHQVHQQISNRNESVGTAMLATSGSDRNITDMPGVVWRPPATNRADRHNDNPGRGERGTRVVCEHHTFQAQGQIPVATDGASDFGDRSRDMRQNTARSTSGSRLSGGTQVLRNQVDDASFSMLSSQLPACQNNRVNMSNTGTVTNVITTPMRDMSLEEDAPPESRFYTEPPDENITEQITEELDDQTYPKPYAGNNNNNEVQNP